MRKIENVRLDMNQQIENANWLRFLILLALNIAYSVYIFLIPGPWSRVLESLGVNSETLQSSNIPEITFGVAPDLTISAIEKLQPVANDYAFFQLLDIPFALINALMASAALALGLKKASLAKTLFRFLLFLPYCYFAAEIMENSLLAGMALGIVSPNIAIVVAQQSATTLKLALDTFDSGLIVISIIVALAYSIYGVFRKS